MAKNPATNSTFYRRMFFVFEGYPRENRCSSDLSEVDDKNTASRIQAKQAFWFCRNYVSSIFTTHPKKGCTINEHP